MSSDLKVVYGKECLYSLRHESPPLRTTRKVLFHFGLWWPKWRWSSHVRSQSSIGAKLEKCMNKVTANGVSIGWLNVQSITNKSSSIRELIDDRSFDVFIASDTWHQKSSDVSLKRICSQDYSVVECSRDTGRGAGLAAFSGHSTNLFRLHYRQYCPLNTSVIASSLDVILLLR